MIKILLTTLPKEWVLFRKDYLVKEKVIVNSESLSSQSMIIPEIWIIL
jgi:hypothetical protein